MEQTHEFRIDVRVYRDTNKSTYDETESFDSYVVAARHLLDLASEDDQ